jgi:hypothetical protein
MKLVVDGVSFQLGQTGIARIWSSLLPHLANCSDIEIAMLDRGNCPSISNIERIEFPSYTARANTAVDSLLIDKICVELGADAFTSTYYTTPVTIPSVVVIYDMIPEMTGLVPRQRPWQERQLAIGFACYHACLTEAVLADLMHYYPAVGPGRATVINFGLDRQIFRPRDSAQVDEFRRKFSVLKPYCVLLGSGDLADATADGSSVLTAVGNTGSSTIEVLHTGLPVHQNELACLPSEVSARHVDLTDNELACAYSGAEAAISLSPNDSSTIPILEAMACGCPVITTRQGTRGGISDDQVIFLATRDANAVSHALKLVREPPRRAALITQGLQHAALYDWNSTAQQFCGLLERAAAQRHKPAMQSFFQKWKELRTIQAEVDTQF